MVGRKSEVHGKSRLSRRMKEIQLMKYVRDLYGNDVSEFVVYVPLRVRLEKGK